MTHLIVGLSNPPEYDGTRHNAGQQCVDVLVDQLDAVARPVSAPGFKGEAFRAELRGEDVMIVPRLGTYMNTSGPAVANLMSFFKIPLRGLILVHDDVALPLGQLRISFDASAGGHNGVRSVVSTLGTQAFGRLRLGIEAREGMRVPPTDDYVLQSFSERELEVIAEMSARGCEALLLLVMEGIEEAMNRYNG